MGPHGMLPGVDLVGELRPQLWLATTLECEPFVHYKGENMLRKFSPRPQANLPLLELPADSEGALLATFGEGVGCSNGK